MPQESVVGRVSPKLVKKVEKEILTEAKNEEKHLKRAIKDLTHVEKNENAAQKVLYLVSASPSAALNIQTHNTDRYFMQTIFKADAALQNADKKEHRTLQDMYKAEHNHEIALSRAQEAQKELEVRILIV